MSDGETLLEREPELERVLARTGLDVAGPDRAAVEALGEEVAGVASSHAAEA